MKSNQQITIAALFVLVALCRADESTPSLQELLIKIFASETTRAEAGKPSFEELLMKMSTTVTTSAPEATQIKSAVLVKPQIPEETLEGCGYRNPDGVNSFITDDTDGESKFGEFPWMTAILRDELVGGEIFNVYECGGAVLAPNVVLTATHCVQNLNANDLVARAGEWDIQIRNEVLPHQDRRVQEIITHEHYNNSALYNDIALLILQSPFEWQENVRPICLPEANANFDFARCYATGWGKNKLGEEGTYQLILKKIELPVVPHNKCQKDLRRKGAGRYFKLHESFICAGGEKDKDTCKGDGGSPLVCPDPTNPERYYQAGIVSWGNDCGEEDLPGVYSNVAYLRNWIDEKLSARGINFAYFTV